MTKRLLIFVFYDPQGIVDEYIFHILEANRIISEKQIFIVNGIIKNKGKERVEKIVNEVILRPNEGFDGGAYRDYFLNYISQEELRRFDEVVLMNDTFYGPFYPWQNTFDVMKKDEYDAWGLTRRAEGTWPTGEYMPDHVQGFFWVLQNSLVCSDVFLDFFRKLPPIKTYRDAIELFEIGFSRYLTAKGFRVGCFIDVVSNGQYLYDNKVQYISDSFNLLSVYKLPILKKKALSSLVQWEQAEKDLEFIKQEYSYPIEIIMKNLMRMDDMQVIVPYGFNKLLSFCKEHERIFIYGAGKWGQAIASFLHHKGVQYAGFIVSRKDDHSSFFDWKTARINQGDGVVIAAGGEKREEMLIEARKHVEEKDLLW